MFAAASSSGSSTLGSPAGANTGTMTSTTSNNTNSDLVSARQWEVFSPPPLNSFRGSVIPKALTKRRRRRKISIEVHRILVEDGNQQNQKQNQQRHQRSYEECIIRVLNPPAAAAAARSPRSPASAGGGGGHPNLTEQDLLSDDGDGDDDSSLSTTTGVSPEYLSQGQYVNANYGGWKLKWRFPVNAMTIKGWHRSKVIVQIRLGSAKVQLRELIFDSVGQAEQFRRELGAQHGLEDRRRQSRLEAQLGDQRLEEDETITFLVEVVSGWNLPVGDVTTSDPFVKCTFNGTTVHETKHISKTRDPIWTLETGSLFLWKVSSTDLFRSDGLQFFVWDFDKMSQDEVLGWFTVPPNVLYGAKGERLEYKLRPPPWSREESVPGYLAVRCRRASEYDKRFMKEYGGSDLTLSVPGLPHDPLGGLKNITKLATESAGGSGNLMSMIRQNTRVVRDRHNLTGTKQYRVRPGPDPKRADETSWMTKEQIEEESKRDSHSWVDSGTGRLGRLFLEVLGCDDLPNLDTGGFAGNKTDAFVSIVYEDTVVTTDIIDDCLSPRWMPWSKRAFIFHMFHSSSQIFLGVFDYDVSFNPADDHDLVGRVTVDLSNLRKDTVYTLKYNIYTTSQMSARKRKGTITIRLRLDIDDERQLLLSSLEPPTPMYVNSKKKRDFRVVRYTCTGKYEMDKYNIQVINSYIEELLALQHALFYVNDALVSVLLWRGATNLTIGTRSLKLPIHSLAAFLAAVLLVERPQLLPSFFLFGIAWIFFATMEYRSQLPDVWSRCKTYSELAKTLALGISGSPPVSIAPLENYAEAKRFADEWRKRITESEEKAAKAYRESVRLQEEYANEAEEFVETDTDMSTKQGGMSIDPFKPLLYPVQQNLALVCRYVRHVKFVIFWEECYISFWVATGCILLGTVFLFVPWLFLIKWTSRAVAWTLFGPWMKLVDIYYVSKLEPPTEEDLELKLLKERERRRLASSTAIAEARVKRENAVKLKAMKTYMFGKYVTRVPTLKEDRYRDFPLPESFAVPYKAQPVPLSELAMQEAGYNRTRLPGQHLVGYMIPKIQSYGFTEAPIGQATAYPRLVDSMGPGGAGIYSGTDSTVAAYTKIGSVVVTAAVVTWVGVPVLASLTDKFLHWIVSSG